MLDDFETSFARSREVLAHGGVILCAGGFYFNSEMVQAECPRYAGMTPLGNAGDDGAGIKLGVECGGVTLGMDRCSVSDPGRSLIKFQETHSEDVSP